MFPTVKQLDIVQSDAAVKKAWNPWMGGRRAEFDKACCFFVAVGGLGVLFGGVR